MRMVEREYICDFIRDNNINSVFEIGTHRGETAEMVSQFCEHVYTLDENRDAGVCCKNSNIVQLYGDSKYFDFREYYNLFDLVVIDGSHLLRYVRCDTRNAVKILKPGGFIIWHDYDLCHLGIVKFVNRFCRRHRGKPNNELGTKLVYTRIRDKK